MADERKEDLSGLRAEIDRIDAQIVSLLDQRAAVVRRVGEAKGKTGASVFRPEREDQILRGSAALSAELKPESVRAIFREILSACRALEKETTVSYLGPAGTFTEMAVLKRFGSTVRSVPCQVIGDVFRTTESGRTDFGVVPVENSTQGTVTMTMDMLLLTPLSIVGEVSVPVVHNLLSKSGKLPDVKRVLAHPQALAQCRQWLAGHLPGAEQVSCSSNAEAARQAAGDPGSAAIAALRAADLYGLCPIAERIQDLTQNTTRFLVLGKQPSRKSADPLCDKSTFVFSMPDKAGALFQMLEPLVRHGVNMVRLESRPARAGLWKYNFFVDVSGHIEDSNVRDALQEIKGNAAVFKFLGSYPAASE